MNIYRLVYLCPGLGAAVLPYVPAIVGEPTHPVDDLCLQVESFLSKEFLEDTMDEEEAEALRSNECIEVTVHGQTTEKFSIKKLEEKLQAEHGSRRIVVPSTDILHHKARSGFPLDVTHQEAMEDMMEEFNKLTVPKERELLSKEVDIEMELKKFTENGQTEVETATNITKIVEAIVVPNPPNIHLTRKVEREIREVLLENDPSVHKTLIIQNLKSVLHQGAELKLLIKQKASKAKWGAMNNRRGEMGENKVALALNQAMEEFTGMSIIGMKTNTYLYNFLEKLNIHLTLAAEKDPKSGVMKEVEHDHISTWVEEDELVVNLVQVKTMEVKPWNPPDQKRVGEAAFEHAKHGLLQILKDAITFKELLPDILENQMRKIR